jgi:D-alanine-D-alanine ligase
MTITINPDWWKTLFDEVYLLTDARSVCDDALTRREIDVISRLLPLQLDDRILDLCGGHGRHSLALCERGYTACTVIDYSMPLIKKARQQACRKHLSIEVVQADARHAGIVGACFDHVLILGNSLGYALDAEADRQIIGEAHRLLCPGGWLLVDVSNGRCIRKSFAPTAWHEIGDDIIVCRQREIAGGRILARELVVSKSNGIIRDETYAMRLYEPPMLEDLLFQAGFDRITVHTDFTPHTGEGDYGFMNHRMLAVGQKPGRSSP